MRVLVGVDPCIHQVVERDAGLHFAVRERVVFSPAARHDLAVDVVQREPLGGLGNGEERGFEISVTVDPAVIQRSLSQLDNGAVLRTKPNAVIITVRNESEIDKVLAGVREAGGKLISVEPVKQSLEELFVEKTV